MKTAEETYRLEDGWIETQNGRFNPSNPTFDLNDIAHALSQTVRFNGHCRRFYSVAEHSVIVSRLMWTLELGDPFEGLMHDGTEAYLSDVPAPFKQFLPDYQAFDRRVETALRAHYKLPPKKTDGCAKADWLALFMEARLLLPSRGEAFADPMNLRKEAWELMDRWGWGMEIRCLSPKDAKQKFLDRYAQLMRDRTL